MSNLYEIIQSLREAQGSKAKSAILEANKDNELLQAYLKAVMDPAISYFQTKMPKDLDKWKLGTEEFCQKDIDFLVNSIAGREFTGHAAVGAIIGHCSALNAEGRELVSYIIKRSIDGNVGDTMILNVWPDLYFIPPYMRCALASDKVKEHYKSLPYFFVQTKRDGSFAYLENNKATAAITRQGSLYPQWFVDMMVQGVPTGTVLVGEMEVYENGKLLDRKTGNGILNSVQSSKDGSEYKQYEFKYVAWDILSVEEFKVGKSDTRYEERLNAVEDVVRKANLPHLQLIQTWIVKSIAEANKIHREHISNGKEGTVWKTPNGHWCDSSSGTKDAVKNKVVFEAEYEVVGWYEGEGKAKGMLGGFTVATSCRKLTNNVGSGFSDKQRIAYWKAIQEGNTPLGVIVTLEANDVISAKGKDTLSLSLPIFIEERFDKKVADNLERVLEQLEAAKNGN